MGMGRPRQGQGPLSGTCPGPEGIGLQPGQKARPFSIAFKEGNEEVRDEGANGGNRVPMWHQQSREAEERGRPFASRERGA